ncbi:hypothetical protein Tco_1539381 [Tanacetum coccineum]
MSTPAYVDSEITTQADGAQSSECQSLYLYPYVAVRQGINYVTVAMASSDFCLRIRLRSFFEDTITSPILPVLKEVIDGTSKLILDNDSEGDKVRMMRDMMRVGVDEDSDANDVIGGVRMTGSDHGVATGISVADTAMGEPLGLGYEALRRRTRCHLLLFVDIDRDVKELYTRLGMVRDEIFSQRYRFGSLERKQERTVVMFRALWRPVLTLEGWAGHVDTRMEDMSRAGYDDHRLIHGMLVQQAALQRELQETRDRVTSLEQERDRRER